MSPEGICDVIEVTVLDICPKTMINLQNEQRKVWERK